MTSRLFRLLPLLLLVLTPTRAAAAIAVDVQKSTDKSAAAKTVASPAFSTTATNELLLAFVATDGPSAGATTVSGVAGGGLTWTLVSRANAQVGTAEIWRAFSAAVLTNATVTATLSRSVVSSLTVMTFTGTDTSGANGSGAIGAVGSGSAASGAPSASIVTTRSNSLVLGVGNDWDQAIARTPGSGQSLVHQNLSSSGDTYWVQRQNSTTPTAGATVAISDTAPTTDRFNLAVCEVLAGGTGATPPVVSLTAPSDGANLTGTTTISATASGTNPVSSVQFMVDGGNLGAPLTSAPYATSWDTTTAADGPHTLTARATDSTGGAATSSPVAVNVGNGAVSTGQWSAPFDLGLVAVNAVMLHTGKVLLYSGSYASSWVERVWDPLTGNTTLVPDPYYNLFCSGQTQLADGRILVVGGYDSATLGAPNANIFDPVTEAWSAVPNMAYRRWYPTATTLPDGQVLVTSGGQTCLTCLADLPEVFDPATNRFSTIKTARLAVPYYPFMFVLPDGSVVDAGANEETVATSRLNLSTGSWTTVDANVKDGHSAAMYLPGKILKTGTAADSGTSGNAASTAYVIDMNQPSPSWRQVASMSQPRAFQNTTLLPDGSVLVTGGGTTLDGYNLNKAVLAAELWSPATETWRTLSSASVPRLYHSVALLLPDGRVLNAGGGNDAGATNETEGQIYSPPYLFKGPRPSITAAPATLQYGSPFTVSTPNAATIASVVLIRPGAVTHAFDEEQRFVPLTFSAAAGALTVQAPPSANLAPPGYYMLFIVDSNGVPSVSTFVRFGAPAGDTTPPTAPLNLAGAGAVGTAALSWTASTDDTGVALYNVYRSTTSGFQPSAANRIGQSMSTSFTDTTGAAGTFFYLATAQDVAANVSAPSNEATVIVLGDTTAPSVTITAPAEQATVSGSVTLSANATDDVAVAGVQFELDGAALGSERQAPPYSMIWNSAAAANGPHTLTAVARDATGNRSQTTVDVSVSNDSSTPSGLVAAYGFNEGAGVQAHDSSGQGNTGTIASATWSTAGKFGNALSFNGTSAWVTVADASTLDLTTGMTLEAWVNPSSGTGWRAVIEKETAGGLAYALYSANNGSRPAGYVHTSADMPVTGTSAVPVNVWTHVALTYDGSMLRIYVNGALVKSSSAPGSAAVSASALRIGGDSVWGEYFRGLIDEVRVYNRALSATEIQADMSTPIP